MRKPYKKSANRILCEEMGITLRQARRYGGAAKLMKLDPAARRVLLGMGGKA